MLFLGGAVIIPAALGGDTAKEIFEQGAGVSVAMARCVCASHTITAWTQTDECRKYLDHFDQVSEHYYLCSSSSLSFSSFMVVVVSVV